MAVRQNPGDPDRLHRVQGFQKRHHCCERRVAGEEKPNQLPLLCPMSLADVMSLAAAFCSYLTAYDLRDRRLRSPPGSYALSVKRGLHLRPIVSPLMIPLVYGHIKSFQRASRVEKPWPGGEQRRDGWAAHPVAW